MLASYTLFHAAFRLSWDDREALGPRPKEGNLPTRPVKKWSFADRQAPRGVLSSYGEYGGIKVHQSCEPHFTEAKDLRAYHEVNNDIG